MELEPKRTGLEKKLFDLASQIVLELGYELYDLVYIAGSSTLRIFIMNPETGSAIIEDCIKVDRAFSPICDVEEWIPSDFVLEVSSPGVYRTIKTKEHFNRSLNDFVLCTITGELTAEQVESLPKALKRSNKLRGKLKEVLEEEIVLNIEENDLKLSFSQIKKASLDPDLKR